MPPRFGWWTAIGVWLPMGTVARDAQMVFPIVRLKPGVTTTTAEGQLHALHQEVAKDPASRIPKEEYTTKLTNHLTSPRPAARWSVPCNCSSARLACCC